jgi:hypothetical protein
MTILLCAKGEAELSVRKLETVDLNLRGMPAKIDQYNDGWDTDLTHLHLYLHVYPQHFHVRPSNRISGFIIKNEVLAKGQPAQPFSRVTNLRK